MRVCTLALLLFVSPLVPAAWAQTAGTITGVVTDRSGAVLPGVTVTARHTGTGLVRSTVTSEGGRYAVASLQPGTYHVRAELAGFKPHLRPEVTLAVAETLAINITLQVGGVEIDEIVVGAAPSVNTSTSELSYLVGADAIEQLPLNGRNYTDLALLQPGVIAFPHRDGGSVVAHGLGMSVNGQDPRSNVYLLDGTLQNDLTNGPAGSAAGTALGMDTVQEFRVETNAYSAEFGRNSGGQINVLTKSGTNRYSGALFEFHRNDALDARNFFDVAASRTSWRNQFGGDARRPARAPIACSSSPATRPHRAPRAHDRHVVPDDNARLGILPDPANPGGTLLNVGVNPAVAPFLASSRVPNGRCSAAASRRTLPVQQRLDQHFLQGRLDYNPNPAHQFFAAHVGRRRPVPADRLPAVPAQRSSRQPVLHGRVPHILSPARSTRSASGSAARGSARTSTADTTRPLPEFVPGRHHRRIDVGGMRRFGPQTSANVRLVQNVFSLPRPVQTPRPAPAEGRRARRALPGQHGEPDVQPRHLRVPEPQRLPARRAEQLHRPHARGPVRPLLALHALRLLPAGRVQLTRACR
jgi:hypothetical protein